MEKVVIIPALNPDESRGQAAPGIRELPVVNEKESRRDFLYSSVSVGIRLLTYGRLPARISS